MITKNKYFLLLALLSARSVFCDSELRDNTHDMTVTVQQEEASSTCDQKSDSESSEQQEQDHQEEHALRKKFLRGLKLSWDGAKIGSMVFAAIIFTDATYAMNEEKLAKNMSKLTEDERSNLALRNAIKRYTYTETEYAFQVCHASMGAIMLAMIVENFVSSCINIKNCVRDFFKKNDKEKSAEDTVEQKDI